MSKPTENWEVDFAFNRIRHLVQDKFGRAGLPDLNALLFLIGLQELGRWEEKFTKEQKQDLMHIAVCRLLSYEGHYTFVGRDADGWPHYDAALPVPRRELMEQETLLKHLIVRYFNELEEEEGRIGE
ncbi:MAG: hypothetical protein WBA17_08565 [Saprospiraceae bacterium]